MTKRPLACYLYYRLFWSFLMMSWWTVAAAAAAAAAHSLNLDDWIGLHGKSYGSWDEYKHRRSVWVKNQDVVQQHNADYEAGRTTYAMSIQSPFADMTDDEFRAAYLMEPQQCSATTHISSGRLRPEEPSDRIRQASYHYDHSDHHHHVDWRTKGILAPVKNQGHCGSCWTFSTTGCLEAHLCLARHRDCTDWTGLAEQQLLDCAGGFNNFGCSGGLPSQAFEYIKYGGGLAAETAYPYHANETGTCQAVPSDDRDDDGHSLTGQVAEVFNITSRDEEDLVHAIATIGPVSVAYQVSPDFRLYSHGIYDAYNATTNRTMCHDGPSDVNHAVVAVGLGADQNGLPFYIVRNSWGTSWGMEGHFWIKQGQNLCGISDCASFPIVPAIKTTTTKKKKLMLRSGGAVDSVPKGTRGSLSYF